MTEQHPTVPSPYRFGKTVGTCPTCGETVELRAGIWRHAAEGSLEREGAGENALSRRTDEWQRVVTRPTEREKRAFRAWGKGE